MKLKFNLKIVLFFVLLFVAIISIQLYKFANQIILEIKIKEYESIVVQTKEIDSQFLDELISFMIAVNSSDSNMAELSIENATFLFLKMRKNYDFMCAFQEENKNKIIFGNDTKGTLKKCEESLDWLSVCWPNYLSSLRNLTSIIEQKDNQNLLNWRNLCNLWLANYNVAKNVCDYLENKYGYNATSPDLSYVCKIN